MPKEVKAKGERKKRAKKGNLPEPINYPPFQIQCANMIIDPNAPKRGLSAYMFFAQVCIHPHRSCGITNFPRSGVLTLCRRRTVIRSGTRILTSPSVCPSISNPYILSRFNSNDSGQIGKILGERWKNMTDKDKQQYEAKATKDKERYEAEKRAYHV